MKHMTWTSLGAVGAALLASACCIGPLVFAVLGLGAFGLGATFERMRPLLTIVTLLVLGVAFYLTYRRRPVTCADATCQKRTVSRWNKVALWIVTGLVIGALTFPSWSPVLLTAIHAEGPATQVVHLGVSGMTCAGCAVTVQKALTQVPGVETASVDFGSGTATVQMKTGDVPMNALVAAVEQAGYRAESLNQKP